MVTETFNIHNSDLPSTFAFEYGVSDYENIKYIYMKDVVCSWNF